MHAGPGSNPSRTELPTLPADALSAIPLLDSTPHGILLVTPGGEIEFANRLALGLVGFARDELRGRQLDTLLVGGIEGHTADQPYETSCHRGDGTEVPVEVRVGSAGTRGSLVVTLRDARDLQTRNEASMKTEAKLRALVEQISAITYTWTWREEEYVVVYASPQMEPILGYTTDEWVADPAAWYEWVHPEDRPAVIAENKRCEQTAEAYSMQYRMIRKDGRMIWVEDSWVVVEDELDGQRVFQGVVFDITERKLAEREIEFLAHHDKLTGLPNRAAFEEALEMAISRARRHDLGLGVLFLDLDNFKLVNDSLGHHVGDRLLVALAERLRQCTRETDFVARQGGDEFLILVSDLERSPTSSDGDPDALVPETVAHRIREGMREPFDLGGRTFQAGASIGISLFPRDGLDPTSLLKNADAAMYQAKRTTPGAHLLFAAGGEEPLEKLEISTRLRRAVEQENWVLHYQPIVDLSDGRMCGVEALIRWKQPTGGLLLPGEFIPLAEELGLIEAIGDWVIDGMAHQQRSWADSGLDMDMSFNLPPRQLWSAHLPERILDRLNAAGVDPHKIVVEVTESTAMAEPDRTQKILAELHAWGLTLAIDDFGTGYSSLARLKIMPVDILKIDRAFVRDVDKDSGQAGMVSAMIQLAQSLNMTPFAEGVETRGECNFLRSNGCRLAQGFYFAPPAPADAIAELWGREGGLIAADAGDSR